MIQPSDSRFDEDPEELELPARGARVNDDESWQPDDDSDLNLELDDSERGLDADTGLDEDESDPAGDDEREEESWLEPGELRAGLAYEDDGADDEGEGEERNWSEGSEPPPAGAEEFIDDFAIDEGASSDDDSGQEGFGDDNALPDLDFERLPPLDDALAAEGEDGDIEAFTAELLSELKQTSTGVDALDGEFAAAAAEDVRVEIVLEGGPEVQYLAADGDTGIGWNGSLLVAASRQPARTRFSGAQGVLALAVQESSRRDSLHVALAMPGAVLCSSDGGYTFAPACGFAQTGLSAARHVAWSPGDAGPRLWVGTPDAGVWSSDDLGGSFRRMFDAAEGASIVAGEDGLRVCPAGSLPAAAPLASRYDFACMEAGWVLRRRGALGAAEPVLCVLPASAGAPRRLVAAQREGRTTLHIACERAWVRVVVLAAVAARRAP